MPYAFFPITKAGHGAWGANKSTGLGVCIGSACKGLIKSATEPISLDLLAYRFLVAQLKLPVVP